MRLKTQLYLFLFIGALFVLGTPSASADPGNGFGLFTGAISATEGVYRSHGITLAGDAQFVVSSSWSINPYLLVSAEHGDLGNESNNVAGLQLRYWMDEVFVAPQMLFHDRILHSEGQGSTYGVGLGLAVGWEGRSGWILQLQYNAFQGQFYNGFSNPSDARSDYGLQVGYRWR